MTRRSLKRCEKRNFGDFQATKEVSRGQGRRLPQRSCEGRRHQGRRRRYRGSHHGGARTEGEGGALHQQIIRTWHPESEGHVREKRRDGGSNQEQPSPHRYSLLQNGGVQEEDQNPAVLQVPTIRPCPGLLQGTRREMREVRRTPQKS